ncbi:MAG: DUF1028 domain-containing protein [Anaerolineales bacterium]|nr:DUF1028 domain-containing protein [Anaerolineales bacterium]
MTVCKREKFSRSQFAPAGSPDPAVRQRIWRSAASFGNLLKLVATFSIVAYDPENGDLGVAVQSKFLAVGAVVPWAKAGIGAIATQSWANTTYGPEGLRLMAEGLSAQEALERLIEADEECALRQAGMVDARGNATAYTGAGCFEWAGHIVGEGFACQGNILVSQETVQAMARTFEESAGELSDRLAAALEAGQKAGGDSRGRQSAALLVVREKGGYGGFNDRWIDLRVDDHPTPIQELKRLLELHKLYFLKSKPEHLLPLEGEVAREVQCALSKLGYYSGEINDLYDNATRQALLDFTGIENLEERWQEGAYIDPVVLEFMRHEEER